VSRRARKIDREAIYWVIEKECGLSPEQQLALDAWLAKDCRHRGAFIRAEAWNMYINRVASQLRDDPLIQPAATFSRRRLLVGGISAAAALSGVGLIGKLWIDEGDRSHETRVGEVQKVALTDSSALLLNTATQVRVDYGADHRATRFLRGEALFTVRPDPRPFIVQAGEWTLRTAEGEFDVREYVPSIRVAVREGILEVRRGGLRELQRLVANEEAILGSGAAQVRRVASAELERRLAWRVGMVVFDGQSVREALAEINRYTARKISVSDLRVLQQPISGGFHITDLHSFIEALQSMFRLRAVATAHEIVLSHDK
jgi:transmembrane sensor